jgi:phosphopantothenoylcysteine synthetase/decarboxylase
MRVLITAGPTREAIDPVRFVSNRSSGKMGVALAEAMVGRGHEVVLVHGPLAVAVPAGVVAVAVVTADEMYEAVAVWCMGMDAAICAAAVADYRPVRVAASKIKKGEGRMVLELEPTRDVLGSMRAGMGYGGVLVGFAAETEALVANAMGKLRRKGCDLVVANDVSREGLGFEVDRNEVILCYADGRVEELGEASKGELAGVIVGVVEGLVAGVGGGG